MRKITIKIAGLLCLLMGFWGCSKSNDPKPVLPQKETTARHQGDRDHHKLKGKEAVSDSTIRPLLLDTAQLVDQGIPMTSLSPALIHQLTDTEIVQRLVDFGLEQQDAQYVVKNHRQDALTVAQDQHRLMEGVHYQFGIPTNPPASWGAILAGPMYWSGQAQKNIQRMFGLIKFMFNAPKFKQVFNRNLGLLQQYTFNGATQAPARNIPSNFEAFKQVANHAMTNGGKNYQLFLYSQVNGGEAYGDLGGELKVYLHEHGVATGSFYMTAGLLMHEITHTWGYSHDGANVLLNPNNIPYYVQAVVAPGFNTQPSVQGLLQSPKWPSGADVDMFTYYFGEDMLRGLQGHPY
ncbi:hypothetical protein [Persicobacter psychrovividus]|uniref:Uncharacterized protein n=1 Tax=Persicobacter psychrovividus TaxID=387638 RepID=A0ABN6L9R4_9BACT|nr:hypothetical protein PEPS_22430 [Persicobacter psychrovividus]